MVLVICTVLVAAAPLLQAADDGLALYKSKCAMCHGPSGKGDTPMGKTLKVKDLSSADVQKQSDDAITQTVVKGKGKMPSFGGKLSNDQIKAIVGHVRSFAAK
jgi:cytochrome c6